MALFGLVRRPIALAPMGGGPGTPALAAAVSEAGGLGVLASGYKTAAQVQDDMDALRARTAAPFGVNVFVPNRQPVDQPALDAYLARLAAEGHAVGNATWDDDGIDAKIECLLAQAEPVACVSFTFGLPPGGALRDLRRAGTRVVVTVTTIEEGEAAVAAGADALCAQGFEGGAHRGSFDDTRGSENDIGLLALLGGLRRRFDVPLIASGALMDGRDIAAVLVAGADAAQLGTAFLRCPEAGTNPTYARALAEVTQPTAITRAFSGRRARGIVNPFLAAHPDAPSAYPQLNNATRGLRRAAADAGDPSALS